MRQKPSSDCGDVDSERIDKLKRRIAIAYEERRRKKEKRKAILKFASFGAAAVLLVAFFFVPQHWSWIESWSTPDEQQRVLIGHEVTVDRVAKALADHATVEQQTYSVNSSAEIDALLGFHSGVPQTLDDEWTLSRGYVDYMSGYIKLSLIYVSSTDPQKRISANMNLFTDIERAAFAFEQTNDGQIRCATPRCARQRLAASRPSPHSGTALPVPAATPGDARFRPSSARKWLRCSH